MLALFMVGPDFAALDVIAKSLKAVNALGFLSALFAVAQQHCP